MMKKLPVARCWLPVERARCLCAGSERTPVRRLGRRPALFGDQHATHGSQHPATASSLPRGFTLTEVMIAIALVMVLIVGVAQVFQMTSQTISAGQALARLTRDARAAETTMAADVMAMVNTSDQPAIVLWSQRTYAFLNENEHAADMDGRPETIDATGAEIAPADYGPRNHRIDVLSFFVNGYYHRQTGATDNELITSDASSEAWISYGHLMVPRHANNPPSYLLPPSASSDPAYAQQYARNWILGRSVILLNDSTRGVYPKDPGDVLSPLRPGAPGMFNTASPAIARLPDGRDARLYTSRFDVANTSLRDYFSSILNAGDSPWYRDALLFRFEADPFPDPPYDAADIARMTPIFLRNCTGFVVEYAGDFLGQYDRIHYPNDPLKWGAPYSTYTHPSIPTDGQVDFFYDPPNHASAVKKIRWYGLPRDTNGDGAINFIDVVPLRDVWYTVYEGIDAQLQPIIGQAAPFERDPSDVLGNNVPEQYQVTPLLNRTTGDTVPNQGYMDAANGMRPTDAYLCAWGPTDRKPTMIRITLYMNDPNNRLPEGQVFQYVLKVP